MVRTRRRRFGIALVAVLALAGCNRVERETSNEVAPINKACFRQALSGDGRWVAFSTAFDPSGETTDQKTILRDLRTGHNRALAGDGSLVSNDASISRDGARVIMLIPDRSSSTFRNLLFLWTAHSGVRRRISPLAESIGFPVISADGRKVAYTSDGGLQTWIYDVGTGTRKLIPRPADLAAQDGLIPTALSSTGRYLLTSGYFAGIHLIDTVTGTPTELPPGGYLIGPGTDISADGRFVVYSASDASDLSNSSRQLTVWDRTTHHTSVLTHLTGKEAVDQISISADGSRIAYTVTTRGVSRTRLETIGRSGAAPATIAKARRALTAISIAGDGRSGVFCTADPDLVPGSPAAPNLYTWS